MEAHRYAKKINYVDKNNDCQISQLINVGVNLKNLF